MSTAHPLLLHGWAIGAEMKPIPPCRWMILILSAFKGFSPKLPVLSQRGKAALWVQQGRNRDFPASAWAERDGLWQVGCWDRNSLAPCSAKGSLSTRQQRYQHRNQRLTLAHRGALQAFLSLFGDPSSHFNFFLLSFLLIFILLYFRTPLPSAFPPDVRWNAFTGISRSLLGSAQKPSPWEAWVRGMLRFPAVFCHSGCQFWLMQVSGITVNERMLLLWCIISLFMYYFLPSDLYRYILHLLFFPPNTFLLLVPTARCFLS